MEKEIHDRLIQYLSSTSCSKISTDIGVRHRTARHLKEESKRARAGGKECLGIPAQMAKLVAFYLTELNQSSSG